ncbi:aminotransferase class I/II-fold pyridoxal phosphate-dependent enzyme [Pseudooceanicola sp.]|uniref:pyridoxal phosphate-dependent aminotransferase n=1 Tax=Pseudooceanicola sp. TaxID=1914328 RepID=UPI002628CC5C|nr:aminotransferase class I/II-fold pyridoxal phosphate-dependent enzyme [Pseudooceanicola sp.]MDF1854025.1 aminotransferase class I/II-fold pyridoxal phosphate-dependent enzyme [Pseudooceanicola sp.]
MRVSRRGEVDPFIVMDVVRQAQEMEARGRRIIHLEIGQPGTPAPRGARAALAERMQADPLGYAVSLGLTPLRQGIARLYGDWYNVDLDPARVIVTPGSSGAFLLAFTALFDPGARVGIGVPGYPSYRQILKALSLDPVLIETEAAARFQPLPGDVAAHRLDGLLVASPGNPTGTMLDRGAMTALIEACAATDTAFISDEIYHGLEYQAKAVSALEISDDCYVINSFSKYFSMTGWRVGWLVVPQDHVRRIERIAQHLFICAPHASQVVALAALDCRDELDGNLATYATNRELMIAGLAEAGFDRFAPPDGGFYIYADVSHLTDDSLAFAGQILEQAGVAVTPGLDFDPGRGAGTLRFSYCGTSDDIREGLRRLRDFMVGYLATR